MKQAITLTSHRPPRRISVLGGLCFATALGVFAAGRSFTPYASVKPILEAQSQQLPAALRSATESEWLSWVRQQDKAIRARLLQGDLDSMVNLLLSGTSFTSRPRIPMEDLTAASRSGLLRSRVDDLVAGVRSPGSNQRLLFLQRLLRDQGIDPASPDGPAETGRFILQNLLRVAEERRALAERAAADEKTLAHPNDTASLLDRESLFYDRGVSLDTGIFPDYTLQQTLADLKRRGELRVGQVSRVAVIGPGLDFIDKNEESAFDYYPQQTLQPFALYDSLLRTGLAPQSVSLSLFDISARVIDHIRRAREQARKNNGYVVQLPRDVSRPWPSGLVAYWQSLGDRVGTAVAPIPPPEIFPGLETRAVRIRPDVVLACEPVDLNIVVERLNLAATDRFDLIVGTNIFVYYDAFEQALALENVAAMLKPGGLLLTNDRLPEVTGGSIRLAGVTVVPYDSPGVNARQAMGWYRRQ